DTFRHGIWLSTNHGLCFIDHSTGNLLTHKSDSKELPVFRDLPTGYVSISQARGDIWWSDTEDLLAYYSVKEKIIRTHNHLKEKYSPLLEKFTYVDTKDRVWFSTWMGKCLVVEPSGVENILYANGKDDYALESMFFNDIEEDKYGNLWFATLGGVARLSGNNVIDQIIDVPFKDAVVNDIRRVGPEKFVMSTNAGLVIYNSQTKDFELNSMLPGAIEVGPVFVIHPVGDEWWCGTKKGIWTFNPATKKFAQLNFSQYSDDIHQQSVITMTPDSHGSLWITTWYGYIYRINIKTKECMRFDKTMPDGVELGRGNSFAIIEDSRGRIWFGFAEKGLLIYDYDSDSFTKVITNSVLDKSVTSNFAESPDHMIWASSWGNGLFKFDLEGNVLQHLTTHQGLQSNYTSSISIDPYQRIWFGTPEAVQYFNVDGKIVSTINYHVDHTLGEDFVCMAIDSQFNYASLKERILVIDHTLLKGNEQSSPPLISRVSVFEDEIPFSQRSQELGLSYDQNFFTIDFSSPYHFEFPSLQYKYILEGFSRDWVNTGRRLTASFTNVPPGEYVFRVKNSDQNGIFNDEERRFSVVIQPPFWQTTWFYILCSILAALTLFWIYKLLQQRRENKKSDQIIDYFANSVYSENSVNEICWDIARNCISQLGFEDCVVYILDKDRNVMIQKAAFGPKNPKGNEIINPLEIPIGQGIVGTVAQTGLPLLIDDTSKDHRYISDDIVRMSELAVPIIHEQKVIGVIDSEHPHRNYFTNEHLKTLTTIASISSFKIADAQASMMARESAFKLMEVNTLFAESQLKALRAQMNPHFVFNCLNSIQECIVTKKYTEASAYLNKFAKLFRLVLNNSGKLLITIDEEIEILKLYLELESMRFEHSFQYSFYIDPAIESDDILMPSMFLQPIVENALWHGLMHKAGDRKLEISFHKVSEEVFSCSVGDNGIGREKSAELKKQKVFTHTYESKGMKMNSERLEVLRHQGYHATQEVIDIVSADGTAQGTT
ncbi:MAG TPA: histidine kinase, partial [Saprospiraceae bacterium]|nr:histidine kinase [Saprospiraceae bacterium]